MDPLTYLLISLALQILGYLLMPKPKAPPPPEFEDLKAPRATAGSPVYVVFGDAWIEDPNCIDFRDKATGTRMVKAT